MPRKTNYLLSCIFPAHVKSLTLLISLHFSSIEAWSLEWEGPLNRQIQPLLK